MTDQKRMNRTSVVLTGMPGSGKSTVGVLLAKTLGLPFIDTDLLIQCRENALLQSIIEQRGAEEFLLAEARAICAVPPQAAVIATGGSAVLREAPMEHLRSFGTVVFLDVATPELRRRLSDISTRGVVMPRGRTLDEEYQIRLPYYQKYADIIIPATGLSPEQIIAEIVLKLE